MRRTCILATLGPASDDPNTIAALLDAGADAFRLNFSHGTHASHAATVARIRAASVGRASQPAILQDLSGPKIRIGVVAAPIDLREEGSLVIERGEFVGDEMRVACSFDALFTSVVAGQRSMTARSSSRSPPSNLAG